MSVGHSEASFNHSCLKVPVDSFSRRPSPKYERLSSAKTSDAKPIQKEKKNRPLSDYYNNYSSIKSYLEFYESIPDYRDLHHLPNEEFYSRLKTLKITQKRFYSESDVLDCVDVNDEDLTDRSFAYPGPSSPSKTKKNDNKIRDRSDICFCCSLCCPDKEYCSARERKSKTKANENASVKQSPPKINIISDHDNGSDLLEPEFKKHSGYEADQESSTLQVANKSKISSFMNSGDDYLGGCGRRSRSLPITPACDCEAPELCHRFSDITFRNEEYHSGFGSSYYLPEKGKQLFSKKTKKSISRPVPLTSRIPLYDKIMMEKEERRRIEHDRYSEELRSLVKPFSFTKREEEKERLRMICSNPELTSFSPPVIGFKAKPVPKNLFSNYAYERMKEEEFYRALRKKIRAEEMLKSSSLPPSMALREKKFRSKSLDFLDFKCPKRCWNRACSSSYRRPCKNMRKETEFEQKAKVRQPQKKRLKSAWLSSNRRINSATDSSTEISPYESILEPERKPKTRPHSALTFSRNNLASVLRIETARKRLEKEMEDKLRENRLKNEARFKARLVRMTPAWRALNYDKEEDLALRIEARRQEERLKKEKHQRLMESMYGRVYRMPPLFHNERFQNRKKLETNTNSRKGSFNDYSSNDPVENSKTDAPAEEFFEEEKNLKSFSPTEQKSGDLKENSKSCEPSESTVSCEKVKAYESDDTMWQNGV